MRELLDIRAYIVVVVSYTSSYACVTQYMYMVNDSTDIYGWMDAHDWLLSTIIDYWEPFHIAHNILAGSKCLQLNFILIWQKQPFIFLKFKSIVSSATLNVEHTSIEIYLRKTKEDKMSCIGVCRDCSMLQIEWCEAAILLVTTHHRLLFQTSLHIYRISFVCV